MLLEKQQPQAAKRSPRLPKVMSNACMLMGLKRFTKIDPYNLKDAQEEK